MLVTFTTDAYADITMFGNVAVRLLHLMGHSGTVPGALRAEDVPAALERLQAGLAAHGDEAAEEHPPEDERNEGRPKPPISLAQRAYPVVELLKAAAAANRQVMWR
jgi:hypothetical protein